MKHDGGWWQVDFQAHSGETLLVASKTWGSQHLVEMDNLRPGWEWCPLAQKWTTRGPPKGGDSSSAGGKGRGRGRGRGRS